jgi:hypothetical protein
MADVWLLQSAQSCQGLGRVRRVRCCDTCRRQPTYGEAFRRVRGVYRESACTLMARGKSISFRSLCLLRDAVEVVNCRLPLDEIHRRAAACERRIVGSRTGHEQLRC